MDLANDPRQLDQTAWSLLYADSFRGQNRALIANLSNGAPPLTDQEAQDGGVTVNYNDMSMTAALHTARQSFVNAFLKSGNFFSCRTDSGNRDKRKEYEAIVTQAVNKPLKKSVPYFESYRSRIASLCLHGIAPNVWQNQDGWCPKPLGVSDVLLPSATLLGFDNLPFIFLRRNFTGIELAKLTQSEKRDPGWNMPFVDRCLEWIKEQTMTMQANYWPDVYAPEKIAEAFKENSGAILTFDRAPSIACFDIYIWNDEGDEQGWVRRIILDTWSQPTPSGNGWNIERRGDMPKLTSKRDSLKPAWEEFLYSSGENKVAQSWQEIMSFQFADLSSVAPYRYHSVRSLGFLLYGVCTIQNRLNCKFTESVFETLMNLMRVKSMEDVQRALKVNYFNRGFIDDSIQFIPAAERWQPNENLVSLALQKTQDTIQANTGAFAQRRDFNPNNVEKTRFQVMAEVNADTALISAAIMQAYKYQNIEDREVYRRFLRPNSSDPDVRAFRNSVIRQGVPESILVPEAWEVEHEQVMGGGNKTQELNISQQLVQMYQLYEPSSQRKILRDVTLALTDDASRAKDLVPEQPEVSNTVHDTELAFATLMMGLPVSPKAGANASEAAGTTIRLMMQRIQMIQQTGGVGTPQDILGLQTAAQYAAQYMQQMAQDHGSKQIVRQLGDALGQVRNEVKAMAQLQRLAVDAAAQQNGNGQDPETMAKLQAIQLQAQTKAENARISHGEKTAQREISFERKLKQDAQKHALDMKVKATDAAIKLKTDREKAVTEAIRNRNRPSKPSQS